MSNWVSIVAVLEVETEICSHTMKKDFEVILKDAPKITGGEGDAQIFINIPSGYNLSVHFKGEIEEFQTRVVITICGNLRNRFEDKTTREYEAFVKFLEDKDYWIRSQTVKIE